MADSGMTAGDMTFVVFICITLCLSVICNILVLVVMIRTPKMMNPTNIFICNLTVSDILLSGMVIPQNIHDVTHANMEYYEGDFLCRVVYTCPILCIMASIYSMVAISFERRRAIVVSKERRATVPQVTRVIPVIWLTSFIFCIPTIYEHSEYVENMENGTVFVHCGSNGVSRLFSVLNGIGIFILAYFTPLILLLVNYGSILWFFHLRGMFGANAAHQSIVTTALYKGRKKVVKMLILVAALFAISWLPYFTLLLFEKITGQSDVNDSRSFLNMLRIALSVFSTAYNFLLYVVYNNNFRNGFTALFTHQKILVVRKNAIGPAETALSVYQAEGEDEQAVSSVFALRLQSQNEQSV